MNTAEIKRVGTIKIKAKEKKWKKRIKEYGDTWYLFGTTDGFEGCVTYYLISTEEGFFYKENVKGVSAWVLPGKEIEVLEVKYDDESG